MTPALGAALGALVGLGVGAFGAKAINAGLDRQIDAASGEDAEKFRTIRRFAGPVVIVTTAAEAAIVGYVAVQVLAG